MQDLQSQPPQLGASSVDRAYFLLTQIKKYRWLGLDSEAEKLA